MPFRMLRLADCASLLACSPGVSMAVTDTPAAAVEKAKSMITHYDQADHAAFALHLVLAKFHKALDSTHYTAGH
jgi:hypothetical protein